MCVYKIICSKGYKRWNLLVKKRSLSIRTIIHHSQFLDTCQYGDHKRSPTNRPMEREECPSLSHGDYQLRETALSGAGRD